MARLLEIEGLGDAIRSIKTAVADIRDRASDVKHHGTMLAQELQDLSEQLEEHRSDLQFEAKSLGNLSGKPLSTSPDTSLLKAIEDELTGAAPSTMVVPHPLTNGSDAPYEPTR